MMAPIAASLIAPMASSLIQPVASSLINPITEKGIMRAGKGQERRCLPLALHLMVKVLGKGVTRARRGYNNMDHKIFSPAPFFKEYRDYYVFQLRT